MSKREITIWDVLFWIAMLILIVYIILKLFGIINTPEWVNLLPIITLAFAIGVFYQRLVVFMDRMNTRTNYFKKGIDEVSNNVHQFGENIDGFGQNIDDFGKNIDDFGKNIENMNDKIANIDSKLILHEERLLKLEKQFKLTKIKI